MGKSLAQLIADSRALSNTQRSKFVTDDEIGNYVNRAVRVLYDLIIAADESYYALPLDLTFGSGTEAAATNPLPAGFYKVRNLIQNPDTLNARPVYCRDFTNHSLAYDGYWMSSDTISVATQQTFQNGGPYRLWYVPKPPQFGPAINVNAVPTADGVTALTGVWTFANGAFTSALIGASLAVSGAASAGNNATFVILSLTPTTLTTATTGLVNESFTTAVSASIQLQAITPVYPLVTPYQAASMASLDVTLDNFDDFISTWTAMRIVEKKKQDTSVLGGMLNAITERVNAMAPDRSGEPEQAPVLWAPSLFPYRGIFPGLPGGGGGS